MPSPRAAAPASCNALTPRRDRPAVGRGARLVRVTDRVRYALPFGRLAGFWMHPTLTQIFEFRSDAIRRLLEGSEAP